MANTSRPFGLRPKYPLGGHDWNGKLRPYYVQSDYATSLFIGDPVIWTGTANSVYVEKVGGGFNIGTLPSVNIATVGSGNKITGVICGWMPTDQAALIYGLASTERVAMVCDVPNMVYEIQDDGGGALTYTTVGLDAVLIAGTGSTVTGLSGYMMDGGTTTAPAANAAYQLKILRAVNGVQNDGTSDYAVWEVLLNIPSYAHGVAGV